MSIELVRPFLQKKIFFSVVGDLGNGSLMGSFNIEESIASNAFLGHSVLGYVHGANHLCRVKGIRLCAYLRVNLKEKVYSGHRVWLMPELLLS